MQKLTQIAVALMLLTSTLIACDSSSPGANPQPFIPEQFTTIQASVDFDPQLTVEPINLSPLTDGSRQSAYWLFGLARAENSHNVGIAYRSPGDDRGDDSDEFVLYNTASRIFTALVRAHPFHSPAFSKDLETVAWIEECQGYVRSLNDGGDAFHLNPIVRSESCLRPAQLSAAGDVALFGNAQGIIDDEGILRFAGVDLEKFGPIAYVSAAGNALNLAGQDVLFGIPELDDNTPWFLRTALSANGRTIAFRTAFVPENVTELGEIDFPAGIMVIDIESGMHSIKNRHLERRAFCQNCNWHPADDLQISGDGTLIYFLRPDDAQLLDSSAISHLYVYDLNVNKMHRLPIEDEIQNNSLMVDRSGHHVAYLTNDSPILLRLDTGERIELDRALRHCDLSDCEFENYRFVRNQPFSFSSDGSALLIQVIPERAGIDEPQNTEELMLLDTTTLALSRIARDISVDRVEIDSTGELLVIQTNSNGLIPDDDDFDADFFIVRRSGG